jgi:hypothetical protein
MATKKYVTEAEALDFLTQMVAVVEKAAKCRKIVEPHEQNLAAVLAEVAEKHKEVTALNTDIKKAQAEKAAFLPESPLSADEWAEFLSFLGRSGYHLGLGVKLARVWGWGLQGSKLIKLAK